MNSGSKHDTYLEFEIRVDMNTNADNLDRSASNNAGVVFLVLYVLQQEQWDAKCNPLGVGLSAP